MIIRYLPVAVILMGLGLATGAAVGQTATTTHAADCNLEVSLPVTFETTSDYFSFNDRLATAEVSEALALDTYRKAAAASGDPAEEIAQHSSISGGAGSIRTLTVTATDGAQAVRDANAACDALATQIRARRQARINQAANLVAGEIAARDKERTAIGVMPAGARTASEQALFDADTGALDQLRRELSLTLAQPPLLVGVVAHADEARVASTGRTGRNLLIGLAAGVLATFIIVLAVEIVEESRRRGRPAGPSDGP